MFMYCELITWLLNCWSLPCKQSLPTYLGRVKETLSQGTGHGRWGGLRSSYPIKVLNSFLALKTHMGFSQETICVSITLSDLTLNHLNSQGQWFKSQVFFFFFKNWASTEHSDANLAINPWSVTRLTDSKIIWMEGKLTNDTYVVSDSMQLSPEVEVNIDGYTKMQSIKVYIQNTNCKGYICRSSSTPFHIQYSDSMHKLSVLLSM